MPQDTALSNKQLIILDASLDGRAMQSAELLGPLLQVERNILGPQPLVAASHPWRRAVPPSRTRPRRRVEARVPNQAATPKRRPIERHTQQYGRRPLSRAAAWQCVARASQAASVEPLEEPVRAVDGSRSPRRRERLRGRGFRRPQEAPGGSGGAKKWPGRLVPPVWWGQVGSGINPGF